MKGRTILVAGSANMDLVIRVKEVPFVGETVLGQHSGETPGGKGANQAYACARQGVTTVFLGAVGADSYGEMLLQNLSLVGVDISAVKKCTDYQSGTAYILINERGNNSIIVVPGANSLCERDYIIRHAALFEQCDFFITQFETPHEGVYKALELANRYGKPTLLNPAPAPENIPDDVLGRLDYIVPNETELKTLTGMDISDEWQAWQAAKLLLLRGVKNVLVTLGDKGALLANRDGATLFPAFPVKVVDTVAAGDTFVGTFAAAKCDGCCDLEAIRYANAAAALAVSRKGAQVSIPTRLEVMRLLEEQQSWKEVRL